MNVVYTAPNKSHHFHYAKSLYKAGILKAFISGYPRISPHFKLDIPRAFVESSDLLQTLYLGVLKIGLPNRIAQELAYLSKLEQDLACRKHVRNSDIFIFYNGCGLNSCKVIQQNGGKGIVEAVNTHLLEQDQILRSEYKMLNLPFTSLNEKEKTRRLKEYDLADYILLPSEYVKQSFLKFGYPVEKLLKVNYGFNNRINLDERVRKTAGGKPFTVLFVGSISVRKGLRYLIEAFQKLNVVNKKLIIVGPISSPSGIEDLKISNNIVFTGVLKGKQLEDAYEDADVFCLPSLEEGLALVLGEALSFGIPIIASENTGASELITNGEEGYVVPIKDSHALYEKMQLLADDPALRNRCRQFAKSKSSGFLGWEESGRNLVSTLLQL